MKNIFLILAIIISIFACSNENRDPTAKPLVPPLTLAERAGVYQSGGIVAFHRKLKITVNTDGSGQLEYVDVQPFDIIIGDPTSTNIDFETSITRAGLNFPYMLDFDNHKVNELNITCLEPEYPAPDKDFEGTKTLYK